MAGAMDEFAASEAVRGFLANINNVVMLVLFADSAYIGKGVKRVMRKFGMKDKVIKRNTRGKIISKWQETINRKNSKLRVRVEHVFGFMEECLHGMYSRVVGFARNAAYNTLTNLVYNLCRYEQVMRLGMN